MKKILTSLLEFLLGQPKYKIKPKNPKVGDVYAKGKTVMMFQGMKWLNISELVEKKQAKIIEKDEYFLFQNHLQIKIWKNK